MKPKVYYYFSYRRQTLAIWRIGLLQYFDSLCVYIYLRYPLTVFGKNNLKVSLHEAHLSAV